MKKLILIILFISGLFCLNAQVSTVPIGSSGNLYTILDNNVNRVAVNNACNTVVFIHRTNTTIFPENPKGFRYDISTDGGVTWTINQGLLNPQTIGNRATDNIPSAAIFNPFANTNPANAYMVHLDSWANLNPASGATSGLIGGVARLDNASATYTQDSVWTGNYERITTPAGFCQGAPGVFWSVSWRANSTVFYFNSMEEILLFRGTWNNLTHRVEWRVHTTFTPPFDTVYDGTVKATALNMAFDPTGQFGWIGFIGDVTSGGMNTYTPVFYSTTDGGNSWTGPDIVHLEMIDSVINGLVVNPHPMTAFDADMAVDKNGNVHFAVVVGSAGNNPPMADYSIHVGFGAGLKLYDITNSSYLGNGWNAILIDDIQTFRGQYTPAINFSTDNCPQVSRSNDGTKIFFGWLDSNPALTGGVNDLPDFKTRGLDIHSFKLTPVVNWTESDPVWKGKAFFATMSPVCLHTSGGYSLPTVFTELSVSGKETDPAYFHYVQSIQYPDSSFTILVALPLQAHPRVRSGSPCGGGTIVLDANVLGGSGNYSLTWSGTIPVDSVNKEVTSVTVPATGSYIFTVAVFDSNTLDSINQSIVINTGGVPYNVSLGNDTSLGCTGGLHPLIQAVITTGNGAGSSYAWSNGMHTQTISAPPGTHIVTATDAGGCLQDTDTIIVYGAVSVSTSSTKHENCGAGDGGAAVSVTGATGAVNYQWNNGSNSPMISGLNAGTYSVTVTDSLGCNVIDSVVILDSCGVIRGMIFKDINLNAVFDSHEIKIPGIEVTATGGLRTVSNSSGNFELIAPAYGNYSVAIDTPYRFHCHAYYYEPDSITVPVTGEYSLIITNANSIVDGIDFGLADPVLNCGVLSGHIFRDLNSNGIEDAGDPDYAGISVFSASGYAFSDSQGNYTIEAEFDVPQVVSALSGNSYDPCGIGPPTGQTYPVNPPYYEITLTGIQPVSTGNDFGFFDTLVFPNYDISIHILTFGWLADTCSNFNLWLYSNIIGTTQSDCYAFIQYDSNFVSFVNSGLGAPANTPDTAGQNFVGWLIPAGSQSYIFAVANFYLKCNAPAGQLFKFTGYLSCGIPDGCPATDTMAANMMVNGTPRLSNGQDGAHIKSFHQHDKDKYKIDYADSIFTYQIWFKNTSEDTVYHMMIVDTLPPHFKLNTITYPVSSDDFDFKVRNDNILFWEFRNINLPPANADILNSYGFVQFNITMKHYLSPGTKFENRAEIIFNYSKSLLTNTVENILGEEPDTLTTKPEISYRAAEVFPNPNEGRFNIKAKHPVATNWTVELYSLTGKVFYKQEIKSSDEINIFVQLPDLPASIYLVRVSNSHHVVVRKVFIF